MAERPEAFDPETSKRSFTVACPDFMRDALLSRLSGLFETAPGVQVAFEPVAGDSLERLVRQDLLLVMTASKPEGQLSSHIESLPAPALGWGVFCRANHPFARKLSFDSWKTARHVQVTTGTARSPIDDFMYSRRLTRRIAVRVPDFLSALVGITQ